MKTFDTAVLKTLDTSTLKPIFEGPDDAHCPNAGVRLDEGCAMSTRQTRRAFRILDQPRLAVEQLQRLPVPDESRHYVLSGNWPLAAAIPACIELAGEPCTDLYIATLSFSEANVELLNRLAESKQIRRVSMIVSNYFAAAGIDGKIYARGTAFAKRWGFRLVAVRNHSKVMLMAFGKRRYVLSSSGNLRSSANCEQLDVFQSAPLFNFHKKWMEEFFRKGTA